MNNFEWNLTTRIVYGPGQLKRLGEFVKPFGKKAFLVTYADKTGLTETMKRAVSSLEKEGIDIVVYDQIEPNPRVTTVDKGVKKFIESKAEVLVALGGGSVIDATKYISSTAYSGGSSWDYVILNYRKPKEFTGAYPIIAVPTVSASGSEGNSGAALTNWETKEKSFSRSPYRFPKVAMIDPEILASMPRTVTANGGVDIFSHLIEHYLSSPYESEIADRITEGFILTLMEYLDRVLKNGNDLEARGQIALCSLLGWSGLQALGRTGPLPIHSIDHQITGNYDISHGQVMAILLPTYLDYFADARPKRWAKLARRVFGVVEENDLKAAKELSRAVVAWLRKIGMYLKFSDVRIGSEKFDKMANETIRMHGEADSKVPGPRPIDRADILEIYRRSI